MADREPVRARRRVTISTDGNLRVASWAAGSGSVCRATATHLQGAGPLGVSAYRTVLPEVLQRSEIQRLVSGGAGTQALAASPRSPSRTPRCSERRSTWRGLLSRVHVSTAPPLFEHPHGSRFSASTHPDPGSSLSIHAVKQALWQTTDMAFNRDLSRGLRDHLCVRYRLDTAQPCWDDQRTGDTNLFPKIAKSPR